MTTVSSTDLITVRTDGAVESADVDYARRRVEAVLRYARDPVLFVRLELTKLADPAMTRPAVVEVNLDLNGRLVRAQAARPTMRQAVDEVHDRLRDRIRRAIGDWEAIRGSRPVDEPHEWRHEAVRAERPTYFPRPVEDRQVMRHQSLSLARLTVDEAAFDMDMLGYTFHLFVEDGTGVDSVLYITDDGVGRRIAQVEPRPDDIGYGSTSVTVSPQPAPTLSIDQATERLTITGLPFVFFRDPATGRGCVLYHRYDGHYGLITPPE